MEKNQINTDNLRQNRQVIPSFNFSNYNAFKDKEIHFTNFAKVNYICGKNSSGKSTILKALSVLEFVNFDNLNHTSEDGYFFNIEKGFNVSNIDTGKHEFAEFRFYNLNNKININYNIEISKNDYLPNIHGNNNFFKLDCFDKNLELIKYINDNINFNKYDFYKYTCDYIDNLSGELCFIKSEETSGIYYKNYKKVIQYFFPGFEFADNNEHILIHDHNLSFDKISGGEKQILKLINIIIKRLLSTSQVINGTSFIFLIDEPENALHPDFQKKIPDIIEKCLEYFIGNNKAQFFIATHSPFIINSSAQYDDHKVYLIKNFKNLKEDGYSGHEAKEMAYKLLGVGFDDFQKKIIVCEGEGKKADENLYNEIFKDKEYFFVSAGSNEDLEKHARLSAILLKKIFHAQISFFLTDKDNKKEVGMQAKINEYKDKYKSELRFLKRYNIEAYLFDPELVRVTYPNINHDEYSKIYQKQLKEENFGHGGQFTKFLNQELKPKLGKSQEEYATELSNALYKNNNLEVYKELCNIIFT